MKCVSLLGLELNLLNLFDLKEQQIFEKFDENWFEIYSFDLIGVKFSDNGFVWNSFDSIQEFTICEKTFEKFDKSQF